MTALLLSLLLAQTGDQPFLHSVALESQLEGPLDWSSVALEVTPRDEHAGESAFITRRKTKLKGGVFLVDRLDQLATADAVAPRYRKASWVIDFDQPGFTAAWDAAVAALGKKPTVDAVTAFASGYLTRKSYDRGFDLASYVATHRGGDCTEHAVFLAALLRRFGIPARAVVGLALIPTAHKPLAFGHMWVEAYVDRRWRVADAAIPAELNVARLPAGELVDEGPGYALSLVTQVNTLAFQRLELKAGSK